MSADRGTTDPSDPFADDLDSIKRCYTERTQRPNAWSPLKHHPYLYMRQRHRRIRQMLLECGFDTQDKLKALDVLDVGCGEGTNLSWLVELGVDPAHCKGIDLMEQRIAVARSRHANIAWMIGDFNTADVGGPFDLVMLTAVLTSVINPDMKRCLVDRCFSLLRKGGIFFFYDFMSHKDDPGTKTYKKLTYTELDDYLCGRKLRWFKQDYLRPSTADWLVQRFGMTVAEVIQATGLLNIEASFGYVRV